MQRKKAPLPKKLTFKRFNTTDENPEIRIADGLRWIMPYYYSFKTYCKGRWIGKTIKKLYETEFLYKETDINKMIECGSITVNGNLKTQFYILKDGDFILTKIHRHEHPIIDCQIDVLFESSDLLVVNKPSGLPVHPTGRYRYNTVVSILQTSMKIDHLHTVHRIDRLTSGILMFAKNKEIARDLSKKMKDSEVKKVYICKVFGFFPDEEIICTERILLYDHQIGVSIVHPDGKECETSFKRLSSDKDFSIVKCVPKTGRMHQIRVHLQFLGFPIIGDNLYGHLTAFGKTKAKGGLTIPPEEIIDTLKADRRPYYVSSNVKDEIDDQFSLITNPIKCPNDFELCEGCPDCNTPISYPDPYHIMCLHSFKYKILGHRFVSTLPSWSKLD